MELYHGSGVAVPSPEIRITKFTKDFGWGVYCTNNPSQAERWARRHRNSSKGETPTVSVYDFEEKGRLNCKTFPQMSEEWLDLIVLCRGGGLHDYDIVEGPMADDEVWDYLEDFREGRISRAAFWELAKFKHPTHQISFHSAKALACLDFKEVITL